MSSDGLTSTLCLHEWQPNRLWYVDMTVSRFGLSRLQRMVVIKLSDGALVIHNPVELSIRLQQLVAKLGPVAAVIAPSPDCHRFLSEWWLSYPQARFYATPTTIQKRSDLNFDGALSNTAAQEWKGELLQTALLGINRPRKMLFCDPASNTLLLSDNLLALQPHLPLGQKLLTLGQTAGQHLKLPPQDRRHLSHPALLRASVQEVMTWPFSRLLSSNGLTVEQDAKQAFHHAFRWAF
jgi:hypothetical protein